MSGKIELAEEYRIGAEAFLEEEAAPCTDPRSPHPSESRGRLVG
jgi:hypothetical protein